MRQILLLITILCLCRMSGGIKFDTLAWAHNRTVLDTQLEALIEKSVEWLGAKALHADYPLLTEYTDQLQRVLRPSCQQCIDYFEAVAILRSLGKTIKQIVQDDRDDVLYPVLRRSYLAAVWMLQRSRLFTWMTSQLQSNVLSTMFRLYVHHTNRAKGRAVSFHHVSKCGGTTMCQLAASNRCSNPSMDQERNCVLDSRIDGPVWMVAHDITQQGAIPNTTVGRLDASAHPIAWANMTDEQKLLTRNISVEPPLPMWLMYTCPYAPLGRPHSCYSRTQQVQETRSTFVANERTLSKMLGLTQVCPQFTNVIILREPVPHVISLLAEVKFRYVRQLALRHNITSWQPPGWNLTWWETLGPALVGNYATRTLVGRDSFCRSAASMSSRELHQAVDALLGFDMVMTLDRAKDIDLLVSTMLGWPARQFSSQPASRVREVAQTPDSRSSAGSTSDEGTWPPIGNYDDLSQYSIFLAPPVPTPQPGNNTVALAGKAAAPAPGSAVPQKSESGSIKEDMEAAVITAAFGPQSADGVVFEASGSSSLLLANRLASGAGATAVNRAATSLAGRAAGTAAAAVAVAPTPTHPKQQRQQQQQPVALHLHRGPMASQQREHTRQRQEPLGHPPGQQQQQQHASSAKDYTAEGEQDTSRVLVPNWHLDYDDDDNEEDDKDHSERQSSDDQPSVEFGVEFDRAAARVYADSIPPPAPPPQPALPRSEIEAGAAVNLVRRFWLERQVKLMGYASIAAAGTNIPPPPQVVYTQQIDQHGAHIVRLTPPAGLPATGVSPHEELWHSFPRHNFAFTQSDMARLEQLTSLDQQLVQMADLLLDLDTVWLQSLMYSHHYRKRMKSVATTYTACGFSGMMPLKDTVQDHVFQPNSIMHMDSKPWIS